MAEPIHITDALFDETVLKNTLPVIVDFWAVWCPPCKIIAPFVDEIAGEYEGRAVICKLNVDENHKTAQKYGIRSIPTLLFFKGGEIKEQVVGAVPKDQLKAYLDKLL